MTTVHIAQGPGQESTTVPQLFAGDQPPVSTRDVAVLAAQGAIPQYTPLTFDAAAGTFVAWAAGDPISAVTCYAIPDLAVDQRAAVYTGGCFNVDAIAWPASTNEAQVEAAMHASEANSLLTFRKLLWSDQRIIKTNTLPVGPGSQPPPETGGL